VLGPLLFIIFINDIPLLNDKNKSYLLLFADDLSSIFLFKKPGKIKVIIKRYLNQLQKSLIKWRFKLSLNKCNYTIFSNKISFKGRFDFKINDEYISYCKNPVLLGVTFDKALCFKQQEKKCLSSLNLVKILSCKSCRLTTKTLLAIYKSLMR
jgi:hypothetical protein